MLITVQYTVNVIPFWQKSFFASFEIINKKKYFFLIYVDLWNFQFNHLMQNAIGAFGSLVR